MALAPVVFLGSVSALRAQNGAWTSSANANWSAAANWLGGVVADGAGNTAYFTNTYSAVPTITLDTARSIGNLTFGNVSGYLGNNVTISGSQKLTLDNAGNPPVVTCWPLKSAGNSACTITCPLSGSLGLTKLGTGTLWLEANNQSLSGPLTIAQGRVFCYLNGNALTNVSSVVISNGCYLDFYNISVNLSSTNYILNGMGATQDGQLKSTLQADGTTTGTAGSFTINGTVTLNATSDIGGTSPAQTMTLAGTVTGPGGLVKNGSSGTLVLANTNTYAGGTTVSSGLVKAQVAGSLGSGGVVVANGAMLELDNPAAMSSSASLFVLGATNLVNLNYSGAQVVNTLYTNGAPCAAGVWGAIGSSAANQSASFSGSGVLSVNLVVQTSQIADYQNDFKTGGFPTGWRYLWNKPNGWPSAPDNTTGTIGDPSCYANLQPTGSLYTPDGDSNYGNNPPAGYLQLTSSGGHPGNAARAAGERDRYAIAAFTVPFSGYFKITNSRMQQILSTSTGLNLIVHVDANPFAVNLITYSTNGCAFDALLGYLNAGQTIYVAIGPDGDPGQDSFALDFSIATYDPATTPIAPQLTTRYSQAFNGTPAQTNGWSFSWNAPVGWVAGGAGGDQTGGGIDSGAAWQPLIPNGSTLTPDDDLNTSNNAPAGNLYLNASGGHPGPAGNYGTMSRYAVASYKVPLAGTYQLGRSFLNVSTNSNDGVEVMVLVNGVRQYTQTVAPGGRKGFDGELGPLSTNDVIQVTVGPRGDDVGDDFTWDFEIAYATANFSASAPVVNVSSYGAVGDGVTDDGPAIRAALAAAGNSGVPIVVAFDGTKTYRVASFASLSSMDLTGMQNIYLKGNGATISVLPPNQFLNIIGAQNIKVDGFTLTYNPLPYFQANIVGYSKASNTVDIQVWTNYPMPAVDAPGVTDNSTTWQFGQAFGGYVSHFWIKTVKAIDAASTSNRVLRVTAQAQSTNIVASVGQSASGLIIANPGCGQTGNFTIHASYSSQVQFTNVIIRQAPQFVFVVYGNNGPVRFQKIAIQVPPGTQERLVSWRDGFHVKDNRYGPIWEDGIFDGWALQDDCYNLTAMWSFVSAINGSNPQLLTLNYSGVGSTQFPPGDWLREENMDGTSKGAAQIVSAVLYGNTLYVQLSSAIPGLAVGDRLFDEQRSNRGTIIRRCQNTTGDAGRGGGRVRTPVLFQDNNFPDWYMWVYAESAAEGPIPEDITFRRNLFNYAHRALDVGYVAGARAVHHIAFADNTFNLSNLDLFQAYDVQLWANNFILNGSTIPVTMNNSGVATYTGNAVNGSVPGSFLSYITRTGGTVDATDIVFTNLLTLSGAVTNGGQVWLEWTPGAAVTNYLVQRSATNGGPYSTVATVRLDTDYLDSVTNGVTYYYRIQAVNTNGVSAFSSQIAVKVPGNGPPVIGSIPNYTIGPGMTLGFPIPATDTNAPPKALSYWLSGGPTSATLNLTNGLFTWGAPAARANTTNVVTVRVGNNGVPPMSATQSFAVIVTAVAQAATLSFQAGGLQLNGAVTDPGYTSQDVHLLSSSPTLSDTTTLISGNQYNSGGAQIHHSLLSFDLSGLVALTGGNAFTVQNVQLVLTNFAINLGAGITGISQELHLTGPFAAGATWNTYDGVNAWPTAGGTVGNLLSSRFIGLTGTQTWSSSGNLIAAVNTALGGTDHHLYLLLQGANQSNQDNRSQFRNSTSTNQVDRPRLDVSLTVQPPAPPALSFQLNGNVFVVWWPTNVTDYVLQNQFSTSGFHPGAWLDVSGVTSNRYMQLMGSSNAFFRLRQAP